MGRRGRSRTTSTISQLSTRIAGIILAGGSSRRLGYPKQLLPYGDGTLLDHAVAEAEAVSELEPLLLVLPPDVALVPDPPVRRARIVRRKEEDGCSSSLHAGLDALPAEIAAVAILPADQINLTRELITLAVRSWSAGQPQALTLSYRGRIGHPFIFAASSRDRLRTLHGDRGIWRLLEELDDAVTHVEVDADPPQDIDTWADYHKALKI